MKIYNFLIKNIQKPKNSSTGCKSFNAGLKETHEMLKMFALNYSLYAIKKN